MRSGYCARLASTIVLLVTVAIAGGCGYKTEPVPPASIVPRPIDDLRYTIDDKGVTLTWTYPVETVRGTDIADISVFDVYRAVVPLEDFCETCPIPFSEPMEVAGGETVAAGKLKVAEYKTTLLRSGQKYFFKVRSRTSWWASSDDSNIVSFVWSVPAKAPQGLVVEAADSRISLTWEAVRSLIDGRDVDGDVSYQVLRSDKGKDFEVLGEPLTGQRYTDSGLINGRTYFYKVQSLLKYQGYRVDGGVSEVISAMPVDQTPPAPPAGVAAVQTDDGVKVVWEPSGDPEVSGYRVYRRMADKQQPEHIGDVVAPYSLFIDKQPPEQARAYYSVTAVDKATPANESDFSREATTR